MLTATIVPSGDAARLKGVSFAGGGIVWSTMSAVPWRRRTTSPPEVAAITKLPSFVTSTPAGAPATEVVVTPACAVRSVAVVAVRAGHVARSKESVDGDDEGAQGTAPPSAEDESSPEPPSSEREA
jgi:hypothetical protein